MGSPTFGFTGGGGSTPPMFGSNTNPTGGSYGTSGSGGGFPSYPVFGNVPTTGVTSPLANGSVFSGTNGGMQNLSSGFQVGNQWKSFDDALGKAYGKGTGSLLYNLLNGGMFNPQVAAAFLNAMQPGVQRGEANLLQSFGSEGSRFGSAAALGEGDYLSQVNLNEQQTLATMFMQAQQEQLGLLENVLPTLHSEEANKGGWIHDLIGGLEIAGSVAADVLTGGAAIPFTAPLISQGINQIGQGIGGGGGGGGSSNFSSPFMSPNSGNNQGNFGNTLGPNGFPISNLQLPNMDWSQFMRNQLSSSAGSDLGGSSDPTFGLA